MELQERRRAVLRHARRRAALHVALHTGDVLTASRAWERLRVAGAMVTAREAAAARDARAQLGRALRDARFRRAHDDVQPSGREIPAPAGIAVARPRTSGVAAALLAAATILVVAIPPQAVATPWPAFGVAEPEIPAVQLTVNAVGRGRTSAKTAPDVFVSAGQPDVSPTPPAPAPSANPSFAAVAQGALTRGTRASPGPSGAPASGTPLPQGVTTGVHTGPVGGPGVALVSPSPKPRVMPLQPPALPSGTDRFLFEVLDSRTQHPLEDVCVIYGTLTCTNSDPHTNLLGLYWLDIPVRTTSMWSFTFSRTGYVSATVSRIYRQGQGTLVTTIALRRR